MKKEDALIVGGGPCGLSAAIELQKIGKNPLVIEKGNVVHSIYRYPTHQTFFSTSEKLAIGDVPFIIEGRKPKRNQALAYYREVVKLKEVRVNAYERVEKVEKQVDGSFHVYTIKQDGTKERYNTEYVVIATGYYDSPNYMNVPGEEKKKVFHYFKEAHPYFDKDVVVIGGKNSAIDAALELEKAGARVTVVYRGCEYSSSIKPWVLPEFESLVRNELVKMEFNATIKEIRDHEVVYVKNGEEVVIENDYVFAMTGYHPDHSFIQSMGVIENQETGRPHFNPETMETNVENLFIAGVIAAGNEANEIFIENGRFHGGLIANKIMEKEC
ncbi:YpdA family putative bacillithiol disulfide reductase [Massilibacterium senegalense]|uniref:YpdA family putative bacillithiol disulfide reductase n=1 Tax=Massilibacterium senegalense TaxID=1632858 RepID=UPI000782C526|nr:YpdA family putative bacillithiol disulfide reductase [Massilibacterium senegalense]